MKDTKAWICPFCRSVHIGKPSKNPARNQDFKVCKADECQRLMKLLRERDV